MPVPRSCSCTPGLSSLIQGASRRASGALRRNSALGRGAALEPVGREEAAELLGEEELAERAVTIPAVGLRLRVYELAERPADSRDTYGSQLWPAARFLAARLAALPSGALAGLRVLELGCGNGLGSLAASALGAAHVLATDARALPLALLRRAADVEGTGNEQGEGAEKEGGGSGCRPHVETAIFDFASPLPSPLAVSKRGRAENICPPDAPLPPLDVLLAADVGYSKSLAWRLGERCREAMRQGARVLIAESRQMPECRLAFSEALNLGSAPGSRKLRLEGCPWEGSDKGPMTIWTLDTLTGSQ